MINCESSFAPFSLNFDDYIDSPLPHVVLRFDWDSRKSKEAPPAA